MWGSILGYRENRNKNCLYKRKEKDQTLNERFNDTEQ